MALFALACAEYTILACQVAEEPRRCTVYAMLHIKHAVRIFFCDFHGQSISNYSIAPPFSKMAQNLDLRCVLFPATKMLGAKHV